MNAPRTAREALIAEAIGDAAQLIERVESLLPALDRTRAALVQADAVLAVQLDALEGRMTAITENAKKRTVEYLARYANTVAARSSEQQIRVMSDAARSLFAREVEPTLQRLAASLQRVAERADRPWERWFVHAATVTTSSVVTWAVTVYVLRP